MMNTKHAKAELHRARRELHQAVVNVQVAAESRSGLETARAATVAAMEAAALASAELSDAQESERLERGA